MPLLAYWVSRLPNGGNHPAALPILQQLLAAGADPLRCEHAPPMHRADLATRGAWKRNTLLNCFRPA